MTFQDLFKQLLDLFYQLKLECLAHFVFQKSVQKYTCYINKLYYSSFLSWLDPKNKTKKKKKKKKTKKGFKKNYKKKENL